MFIPNILGILRFLLILWATNTSIIPEMINISLMAHFLNTVRLNLTFINILNYTFNISLINHTPLFEFSNSNKFVIMFLIC